MRITNSMMINNTLSNINNNKTKMDQLNTQLATKKKIQRPSEDPITAIRALRYRSTLSEISQYLDRNIQMLLPGFRVQMMLL
jgi:flagellar hook-associated protein 3 FlgL